MRRFSGLKRLLAAAGAVLSISSTASLAEPPSYNWSGLYIGGNIGGAWGSDRTTAQAAWPYDPLFLPFIAANGSSKPSLSSIAGGAQAGWNWQMGGFVWGFEGDIRALSLESATDTGFIDDPYHPANSRFVHTTKMEWLSTLRGRAGITLGNMLLYGTGGLAIGAVKSTYNYDMPWYGYDSYGSVSTVATGWTAGAGIEIPLSTNWTIGLEYLHFDLGSVEYQTKFQIHQLSTSYYENISTLVQGDFVTGTVNYKF